jgi:hypothetical protein
LVEAGGPIRSKKRSTTAAQLKDAASKMAAVDGQVTAWKTSAGAFVQRLVDSYAWFPDVAAVFYSASLEVCTFNHFNVRCSNVKDQRKNMGPQDSNSLNHFIYLKAIGRFKTYRKNSLDI